MRALVPSISAVVLLGVQDLRPAEHKLRWLRNLQADLVSAGAAVAARLLAEQSKGCFSQTGTL